MNLDQAISEIKYWHRKRDFAMNQRKRNDLALGAFLRSALGWTRFLPKEERDEIKERALELIKAGRREIKGKDPKTDDAAYTEWHDVILASLMGRWPFASIEEEATIQMETLAKVLPIYEEWTSTRGLEACSLAQLIGEAGDLSNYPKKGHLRKRMCVAVIEGVRQGGLKKGSPKKLWKLHGYSPKRRSVLWNIGGCLVKNNGEGKYRQLFLQRHFVECKKAFDEGKIVASTQKITIESWEKRGFPPPLKITNGEYKDHPEKYRLAGHISHRAQRYMEQRLLEDMRRTWIRASGKMYSESTTVDLPVVSSESVVGHFVSAS